MWQVIDELMSSEMALKVIIGKICCYYHNCLKIADLKFCNYTFSTSLPLKINNMTIVYFFECYP